MPVTGTLDFPGYSPEHSTAILVCSAQQAAFFATMLTLGRS